MLKLFYASGTSAMAPHILLTDAGLNFELEKVNLDQKLGAVAITIKSTPSLMCRPCK